MSGEGWAAIGGAVGSALLLAKKLLSPKPAQARADEPGGLLRGVLAALKDHIHAEPPGHPGEAGRQPPGTAGRAWSGRPVASTRWKPASPAWTSARGGSHASPWRIRTVGTRSTASPIRRHHWDAVERFPTRGGEHRPILARGNWPALPATRAVAENTHNKERY